MHAQRGAAFFFGILLGVVVGSPAAAGTSREVANVQALYNYLIFPNNVAVFSQTPSPVDALFSTAGVKGRIAPLGTAHDLVTVKRYFFASSLNDNISTVASYVSGVTFRTITAKSRSVAVEVDMEFTSTPLGQSVGLPPSYNLREVGMFTFDKQRRIASFDLTIPYLDAAPPSLSTSDPAVVAGMRNSICQVSSQFCSIESDPFGFYLDFNSCIAFLQSTAAGSWGRVDSNTVVCRFFHAAFVSLDPASECPAIGATGGAACVDRPYSTYFDETF
jgi:hypothetical protein